MDSFVFFLPHTNNSVFQQLKHFEPMWGESLREWPALPPGTMGVQVAAANAQTPPGNKKEISKGISPLNNKVSLMPSSRNINSEHWRLFINYDQT